MSRFESLTDQELLNVANFFFKEDNIIIAAEHLNCKESDIIEELINRLKAKIAEEEHHAEILAGEDW